MVSVYMNGEDVTQQLSGWRIWYSDKNNEIMLTGQFLSQGSRTSPFSQCKVTPEEPVKGNLLIRNGRLIVAVIKSAITYGRKYTVVYYPGSDKPYVMHIDNIKIVSATNIKNGAIFNYFRTVVNKRIEQASDNDKNIVENILKQLDKVTPHPDTALNAYRLYITKQKNTLSTYI